MVTQITVTIIQFLLSDEQAIVKPNSCPRDWQMSRGQLQFPVAKCRGRAQQMARWLKREDPRVNKEAV